MRIKIFKSSNSVWQCMAKYGKETSYITMSSHLIPLTISQNVLTMPVP